MAKSPRWSKEEDALLSRLYYQLGAERAAKLISKRFGNNRTCNAVQVRARKVLKTLGVPDGWVSLVEVEQSPSNPGLASMAVGEAAKADGVVRVVTAFGGRTRIVPVNWADEYVKRRAEANDALHRTRGWMTTAEAAEHFQVSNSYMNQARYKKERYPLWDFIKDIPIEKVRVSGTHNVMWEPTKVMLKAMAWRQYQRLKPSRYRTPRYKRAA